MQINFTEFSNSKWQDSVINLQNFLKKELHAGLIRDFREDYESQRLEKLEKLRINFIDDFDVDNLDKQLNAYTMGIKKINDSVQFSINFDLINYIKENIGSLSSKYPNTVELVRYLLAKNENDSEFYRLYSIFNKVIYDSTIQSSKSNAGNAGEDFVKTTLNALGLQDKKHYKTQHKSKEGSDTDFVLPYVEDYQDINVQIYVAVQFSSSDRIRMVSSELKAGAQAVIITGNGFEASSKNLDAIGATQLRNMITKKNKLICYDKEIKRMISKYNKKLQNKINKDGTQKKSTEDWKTKLDYYTNYASSFSEFAKELKNRYL